MLRSHHISNPIPHKPQASIQLNRSESPSGAPPPSTSRSPSASRAAAAIVVMAGGETRDVHFNLAVSPAAAASPPTLASAKKAPPVVLNFEPQSVLKRLQSELMALMMSGDPGISAFPEEDNIFFWKGTITGSKETVYEGLEYKLSLTFFNDYPFKPPNVRFDTTCFHPNVDLSGNICLDILQNKWSSAYDVRTILLSIQSLLGEPNNDSALNAQAAELWANQKEFRKMVEKYHRNSQI